MDGRRDMALSMIMALAGGGAMAGVAHAAQDEGGPIPVWIKTVFGYYAVGQITDGELIGALQYLVGQGIITLPSSAEPAAAPPMSAEAATLIDQAKIVECLADEERHMIAAWTLDLKASSSYMLEEYEAEMRAVIDADDNSVQATEAWAAAVRQAAADVDVYNAQAATLAGQMHHELKHVCPTSAKHTCKRAYCQAPRPSATRCPGPCPFLPPEASILSGAETECY